MSVYDPKEIFCIAGSGMHCIMTFFIYLEAACVNQVRSSCMCRRCVSDKP